eukprot:2616442-Amphidinium_carterae.1
MELLTPTSLLDHIHALLHFASRNASWRVAERFARLQLMHKRKSPLTGQGRQGGVTIAKVAFQHVTQQASAICQGAHAASLPPGVFVMVICDDSAWSLFRTLHCVVARSWER